MYIVICCARDYHERSDGTAGNAVKVDLQCCRTMKSSADIAPFFCALFSLSFEVNQRDVYLYWARKRASIFGQGSITKFQARESVASTYNKLSGQLDASIYTLH